MADQYHIDSNIVTTSDSIEPVAGLVVNTTMTDSQSVISNVTTGGVGAKGDKGDTGATGLKGDKGDTGLTGAAGTNGQGVPTGGTTGQQLAKINGTDYNTQWVNPVDISGKADTTTLTAHTSNTSNPHSVTKAQVGLSSVPNTDFTSAVAANTAKISFDATSSSRLANTSGTNTGDQVVPAQFNPIAGSNVTLTGTYPNVTFNSSGGGTWGSITGTLSSQTDLNSALGGKFDKIGGAITATGSASGYVDIRSGPTGNRSSFSLTGNGSPNAGDTMTFQMRNDIGDVIAFVYDTSASTYHNFLRFDYLNDKVSFPHMLPFSNLTYDLGSSSAYFSNTYTQKLYLNSTASLDGSTAGVAKLTGRLDIPVTTSTDGQITQGGSTILHTYTRGDGYFPNLYLGKDSGNYTSATTGATYLGTGNLALGFQCLRSVTTGYYNIALGNAAGIYLTTGFNNFLAGHTAGNKLTTGSNNFLMGRETGLELTTGSNNVGIGLNVLRVITTAGNNTAVGHTAGFSATGSANIFLGYQAGYNETGSNKLYIANSSTSTPLIGGDFSANTITTPASIEITDTAKGVILKSPDGTRWRVTIDNTGALTTASI